MLNCILNKSKLLNYFKFNTNVKRNFVAQAHVQTTTQSHRKYKRIGPASRFLLNKHDIHEHELPADIKWISKGDVLSILEQRKKHGHVHPPTHTTRPPASVNIFEEPVKPGKQINYLDYKNKLSHSYYSNSVNIDNLISYIVELNLTHKKNAKIEDVIAKVSIVILHYIHLYRSFQLLFIVINTF
jgi:hypothetical protein